MWLTSTPQEYKTKGKKLFCHDSSIYGSDFSNIVASQQQAWIFHTPNWQSYATKLHSANLAGQCYVGYKCLLPCQKSQRHERKSL